MACFTAVRPGIYRPFGRTTFIDFSVHKLVQHGKHARRRFNAKSSALPAPGQPAEVGDAAKRRGFRVSRLAGDLGEVNEREGQIRPGLDELVDCLVEPP